MTELTVEERLAAIEDRQSIIDILCGYAFCIDRKRWDEFASYFAEEIEVNLIRTDGWMRLKSADLVRTVQGVFESYTATQHLSANHRVEIDGDTAVAWSTLNATHYLEGAVGEKFQQQVGYYEYELARENGWRIVKLRQVVHWQRGNQQIFDSTVTR